MVARQKSLGQRIMHYIRMAGITQRELAIKVNVTEVSISRYVKDERVPKKEILERIADALDISLEELIGGLDTNMEEESVNSCSEITISSDVIYETAIDVILGNRSCWSDKQKLYLIGLLSS